MTTDTIIARFENLPLTLSVELACAPMEVAALLGLKPGSVLKTSRPAGDHFDFTIGGVPAGQGELVVNGRALDLRITQWVE